MPIILQPEEPNQPPPGTSSPCDDSAVVLPDQPLHNGCPVLTKTPSITVAAGQDALIQWVVTGPDGNPVDICACIADDGSGNAGKVVVRIKAALDPCATIYEATAIVVDCQAGIIRFELPEEVQNSPCIYIMEIGVYNSAGKMVISNKGLLSVEPSLFNWDANTYGYGPLTLEEVRLQMRDILGENDLLDDVEFDDIDILHSMIQPIRFWNEIPPDLIRFSSCNFPYHGAWLKATCSNLLRVMATWYERNNAHLQGGGVSSGRRDKLNPYLLQARTYEDEWKEFVERKKIEINAASMYGST